MAHDRDRTERHRSGAASRSRSPRRVHRDSPAYERRSQSPAHKRRRTTTRSLSRSPGREQRPSHRHHHRRHHHHHRHHSSSRHHRDRNDAVEPIELPFSARPLTRADLRTFRPLFGYFLSLQKQIELADLDEREEKGRWKSFIGKWNRGELAEGWYDPDMFARVTAEDAGPAPEEDDDVPQDPAAGDANDDDAGSESDYGPAPLASSRAGGDRAGPSIPSRQDLSMRDEMLSEDKEESLHDLRAARKADRATQKERLEELLPRADPGSRERKMEKRQMVNDKMREFRDKSPGMEGGNEKDLMGGGDSLDEYKRMKEMQKRKKSEREIRREEMERARQEEIEEKRKAWQEREEGTVNMLRELAKQRFG